MDVNMRQEMSDGLGWIDVLEIKAKRAYPGFAGRQTAHGIFSDSVFEKGFPLRFRSTSAGRRNNLSKDEEAKWGLPKKCIHFPTAAGFSADCSNQMKKNEICDHNTKGRCPQLPEHTAEKVCALFSAVCSV